MRGFIAGVVTLCLLISVLAIVPVPVAIAENEDPGPDGKIFGEWVINNTAKSYSDMTIEVTGNVTIVNGGSLALDNVTFIMNSSFAEEYWFEVESGGSFTATNGTTMSNNATQDCPWFMAFRSGSDVLLDGVDVYDVGNGSVSYGFGIDPANFGVLVGETDVAIRNSYFADNVAGVVVYHFGFIPITPTIEDCVFVDNDIAIAAASTVAPRLNNNTFTNNDGGIAIAMTLLNRITVQDCEFVNNNVSIFVVGGPVDIKDTTITGSGIVGIGAASYRDFLGNTWRADLGIDNVTMTDNTNATTVDRSDVSMTHSAITGSKDLDFYLLNESKVEVLDTTFNKSAIEVVDDNSYINVSWYLTVYTEYMNGTPAGGTLLTLGDAMDNAAATSTSDGTGFAGTHELREFVEDGIGRVYFSPYTATAEKGAWWNESLVDVDATKTVTLKLWERDLVDPAVEIVAPHDGDIVNTTSLLVEGSASDDRDIVSLVQVSLDGGNWANATGTTSWSKIIDVTGEGAHEICAIAWDASGNNATACVDITLDTVPPVLLVDSPPNGSIFNVTAIQVKGTTDGANVTVNGNAVAVTSGSYSTYTVLEREGENDIEVMARDVAGNANITIVTVIRDTIQPSIGVASPGDGDVLEHEFAIVKGNVTDAWGVALVEGSTDGEAWKVGTWQNVSGSSKSVSFEINLTLDEGNNTVYIRATDEAGNRGIYSFDVRVEFPDIVAPTVEITSPTEGEGLDKLSVVITGTADDDRGVDKVEISTDQQMWFLASTSTGWQQWSFDATLQEGVNKIYARATDEAGNNATDMVTVNVTIVVIDNTPPEVKITSHSMGAKLKKEKIELAGTVYDNMEIKKVEVSINGGEAPWYLASVDKLNGTWSIELKLKEGKNDIVVVATDGSDNVDETSVTVHYEKEGMDMMEMLLPALFLVLVLVLIGIYMIVSGRKPRREDEVEEEDEEKTGEEE
jgi:hypothetical protein